MKKVSYIQDFATWEQGFFYSNKIKVRFSETDMFGHMNNTVPFAYFEESRIEFFKHIGLMQHWVQKESRTIPIVADLQCDFLHQVFFDDILDIFVKIESVGNTSIDLHYLGKKQNGDVCFVGRGTMVQMCKRTGKGVPWTEETRDRFRQSNKILS
ncbi:acyl-CoA thioesterase [Robertmurraya korlensis]|uniref:acyl-CoA thioesterase n=1 Tax=Robertmurraya korlensis TaxID=519977 RepID=UPI0020426643|nr:thioesterase family protein [Robertmurraya korlensis]MCM3599312.1 acyl-CoA thioesterase [Robertmurraya korlensis]